MTKFTYMNGNVTMMLQKIPDEKRMNDIGNILPLIRKNSHHKRA